MAITQLSLPKPLRQRKEFSRRNYELRDQAIEAFDAGEHRQALQRVLRYLLPEANFDAEHDLQQQALCVVQGSARVRIALDGEDLSIRANIAKLDAEISQVPAALRFFLSNAAGTGILFQPRLGADDLIYLEYRDRLSLSHPQKVIEVLARMPLDADRYDAWIVEQFSLKSYDRAEVHPLSPEEFASAKTIWHQQWGAIDELQTESRRRRSVRFLNYLCSFANSYLGYCLPITGQLRALMSEAADVYNNRDENPDKRDNALAKHVKAMRAVSDEQLMACLNHADHTFNPLAEGTNSLLSQVIGSGQGMQSTGDARASGRSLDAAFELITNYAYLLAYQTWQPDIEQSLREALDQVSDKPWREAAEILWAHANTAMKKFTNASEAEEVEENDDGEYRE